MVHDNHCLLYVRFQVVTTEFIWAAARLWHLLVYYSLSAARVQELTRFVAAHWVTLTDELTGKAFFYNSLAGCTQWAEPLQPEEVLRYCALCPPTPDEDPHKRVAGPPARGTLFAHPQP